MLLSDVLVTSIVIALFQTVPLRLPAFRGRSIVARHQGCCIIWQDPGFTLADSTVRDAQDAQELKMEVVDGFFNALLSLVRNVLVL